MEYSDQLYLTTSILHGSNGNNNINNINIINNSSSSSSSNSIIYSLSPSPRPSVTASSFFNISRGNFHPFALPLPDILKAGALFLLVFWTILANFLVFIVLYKNPRLQTVPNLLVGNLALSDFCLALIVLPLSSVYACAGKWVFNDTLCQIFVSADILCSTASIWNLSIVGLDRYWAITSPVAYLNKRNKKTACLMIVSVWSFSALISLAPLLGWKQVAEHGNLVKINGTWQCTFLDLPSYTIYSATGSFFIPTLLMFFVYFKIYQAFAKHRARQIYRQKLAVSSRVCTFVIRRHIESTILHEISHILPTSDEFAKDVEEEEEPEEEEEGQQQHGEEQETKGRAEIKPESVSLTIWPSPGIPIQHATIYEEDEGEEEEEGDEEEYDGRMREDDEEEKGRKKGAAGQQRRDKEAAQKERRGGAKLARTKTVEISEMNGAGGTAIKWQKMKEGSERGKNGEDQKQQQGNGTGTGGTNGGGGTTKVTFKKGHKGEEEAEGGGGEEQSSRKAQNASILANTKKEWKSFSSVEQTIGKRNGGGGNANRNNSKDANVKKEEKVRRDSQIPGDIVPSAGRMVNNARNAHPPGAMPTYEKVRRHKRRKELQLRKSLQTKPRAISAAKERRGVRVLGIILGCFTLCWTPFFIMYVVVQFCSDCTVNPHIEMFITWLGYSNSAMNPIIYTVFNRDYQIALKRLFCGRSAATTAGIRSTLQRPMIGFSR